MKRLTLRWLRRHTVLAGKFSAPSHLYFYYYQFQTITTPAIPIQFWRQMAHLKALNLLYLA